MRAVAGQKGERVFNLEGFLDIRGAGERMGGRADKVCFRKCQGTSSVPGLLNSDHKTAL